MKNETSVSRRSVLTGFATAASMPFLGRGAQAQGADHNVSVCANLAEPPAAIATPQHAVSLKRISEALAAGRPASFDGLTRLDGYVIDASNRDIVLFGLSEPDQPKLFVEDFVVALRAALGRYGVVRDNINYITTPIISIDPVASVFPRIDALDLRTSEGQSRFQQVCATAQPVRIEGMPRNTRLAKVLVDADYRMKLVGQGRHTLPIENPFPSHWEVRVQKWKEALDRRQSTPPGWHTRLWFQAGRFFHQFDEASGTVYLDRAQVILNDEDQAISGGSLGASGKVDPITRAFCCSWSARMDDVYKAEPIWRDMHNAFRHFAIARIIKDVDAIGRSGLDAQFLLDRYEVPIVPLPATLPGTGKTELYLPPGRGSNALPFTWAVCGGVAVGFSKPVEKGPLTIETANSTAAVLVSRLDPSLVSWKITSSAATPSQPAPSRLPGSSGNESEMQTSGRFGRIQFQ